MPEAYIDLFRPNNPFPENICKHADAELDQLASILQGEGIKVYRPNIVNWQHIGGYTGSMPRDGLITIGNHIIESAFAWNCRRQEIELEYGDILRELGLDASVKVIRAPKPPVPDTIYDDIKDNNEPRNANIRPWAINNIRPAFDAADFMRFGTTVIDQYSHVTNHKGVEYFRSQFPEGYEVEILKTTNPHAMHIDTVILPLR
ncbi:MAG: hypothetical protein Q9221_008511 [Calogaya cf. arnoldii]